MRHRLPVELCIPNQFGLEKLAMEAAAELAEEMGFSAARIEDLKTATAEACINAFEHGNGLNAALAIQVVVSAGPDQIEVQVLDHGPGVGPSPVQFDSDQIFGPSQQHRGMGRFLIQELTDEAEWYQGPPGKSFVRFVLRLHGKEAS